MDLKDLINPSEAIAQIGQVFKTPENSYSATVTEILPQTDHEIINDRFNIVGLAFAEVSHATENMESRESGRKGQVAAIARHFDIFGGLTAGDTLIEAEKSHAENVKRANEADSVSLLDLHLNPKNYNLATANTTGTLQENAMKTTTTISVDTEVQLAPAETAREQKLREAREKAAAHSQSSKPKVLENTEVAQATNEQFASAA